MQARRETENDDAQCEPPAVARVAHGRLKDIKHASIEQNCADTGAAQCGGVIRNSRNLNFHKIFFDRERKRGPT